MTGMTGKTLAIAGVLAVLLTPAIVVASSIAPSGPGRLMSIRIDSPRPSGMVVSPRDFDTARDVATAKPKTGQTDSPTRR